MTDRSIKAINNFAEDNPDVKTFAMIVPTSAGIYKERLPENAPNEDQKECIDEFYSAMSDKIMTLDAYSALNAEKDEYIYYRNDHHWTTGGAYAAYSATIKKMSITGPSLQIRLLPYLVLQEQPMQAPKPQPMRSSKLN